MNAQATAGPQGTHPLPIEGVLFDFHQTLVDASRSMDWLQGAWANLGRPGDPAGEWGGDRAAEVLDYLANVWTHAGEIDPDDTRDLDAAIHRDVWDRTAAAGGIDTALAGELYRTLADHWILYDDAIPVIGALRERGVKVGVLSNIGVDIRPNLREQGLLDLVDAVVMSYEVGVIKPSPAIFLTALERLGVSAERALMVGDSAKHDAGAAAVGIRTLLLPRTLGAVHGLDLVLRLVG